MNELLAACRALVGIVEGQPIRWAGDGVRLKDTPEWVAFYCATNRAAAPPSDAPVETLGDKLRDVKRMLAPSDAPGEVFPEGVRENTEGPDYWRGYLAGRAVSPSPAEQGAREAFFADAARRVFDHFNAAMNYVENERAMIRLLTDAQRQEIMAQALAAIFASTPLAAGRVGVAEQMEGAEFFADNGDGIDFFATLDEAKAEAEKAIDYYRDEAGEGWNDDSLNVCYGIVIGKVQITEQRPVEPDDNLSGDIGTYERRELVTVTNLASLAGPLVAGEVVTLIDRLIVQDTVSADECEAMASRLGEANPTHNELLRDAAQYRQSAIRLRLVRESLVYADTAKAGES